VPTILRLAAGTWLCLVAAPGHLANDHQSDATSSLCISYTELYTRYMSSPLSPEEIRAAAEVHRQLGPEYSDAVVESFLERVDRQVAERVDQQIAARADAGLAVASRKEPIQPAQPDGHRILLAGVAIGIFVTGVPSVMIATGGGGVLGRDETQLLLILAVIWAVLITAGTLVRRPRGRGTATDR